MTTSLRKSSWWMAAALLTAALGPSTSAIDRVETRRPPGESQGAADRRLITESDILKFNWIADPQISPDGSQVAFVKVVVNEQKDDYETSLWLVPANGSDAPRRLTSGAHDSTPRWSPDGKQLAFVRAVERQGRTQPAQIFLMSMDGGEGRAITDLARGAGAPLWSPDGTKIVFSSSTRPDEAAPADAAKDRNAPKKSDVRVITSAKYRSNGGGWDDASHPSHIWVTAAPSGPDIPKATQLTRGEFDENGPVWSPDGSRLFFTSNRVEDAFYYAGDDDLYAVPAAGGEMTKIADIKGTIGNLSVSPDGRSIAFIGSLTGEPERSYSQSDLFVVDLTAAKPAAAPGTTAVPSAATLGAGVRNLTTSYDFDIGGGIGGDQAPPRGGGMRSPIWASDGASLVVVSGEQGDANLLRFDAASGKPSALLKGSHAVQSYTSSRDRKTVVALVSTQTNIGDLFVVDVGAAKAGSGGDSARERQITRINEDLFKTLKLSEPEEVTWTSFDGKKIEGWVLHPPDFDKAKKYPFILEIHGGPHSAYGNVFTHEFQWMAAKGYVVLFPNPRGSSNYGQDFGNVIQFHYPGDDYKDLMAGVDMMVKRGYIDEKRMGVTGGSGGGLLTNWTITQTTRFAAAVSMRSIADWSGFWYTADFSQFTPSWFRKAPWEDPADYTARSPITYIAKVKTPTMLIDGDDDLRTPPADGGEIMFRALKYLKVPTVMVRFPGETHELSRSGKPQHRIERLRHILGWFDKWLMGQGQLYRTTAQ